MIHPEIGFVKRKTQKKSPGCENSRIRGGCLVGNGGKAWLAGQNHGVVCQHFAEFFFREVEHDFFNHARLMDEDLPRCAVQIGCAAIGLIMLSYSPQKSKSFLRFSANFFAAGREVPKFLRPGVELGRRRAAGEPFCQTRCGNAQKSPAGGCTGSAPAGRKTEMRDQAGRDLQGEVTLCVVEADALDDLLQSLFVVGILAILDPLADDVAQDAAEVVVAGVAQEAAAVGQHTDEDRKSTRLNSSHPPESRMPSSA